MANFFFFFCIKVKSKQALDCKFNPTNILNSVVNNKGIIDRSFPTAEMKVEKPNYKSMKTAKQNLKYQEE